MTLHLMEMMELFQALLLVMTVVEVSNSGVPVTVEIGDDPSLDMDNNQMTISYLIEIDRTGTGWSPAIEKGSGLNNCGTGNLNYYTWYGNTDLQIDFVGNTNLRGQLYHATTDDFYTGQFRLITITIDQSNIVSLHRWRDKTYT